MVRLFVSPLCHTFNLERFILFRLFGFCHHRVFTNTASLSHSVTLSSKTDAPACCWSLPSVLSSLGMRMILLVQAPQSCLDVTHWTAKHDAPLWQKEDSICPMSTSLISWSIFLFPVNRVWTLETELWMYGSDLVNLDWSLTTWGSFVFLLYDKFIFLSLLLSYICFHFIFIWTEAIWK